VAHWFGSARLLDEAHQLAQQGTETLAGDSRDALAVPGQDGDVGLGADGETRTFEKLGLVAAQLVDEDALLLGGIPPLDVGQVDEHEQDAGTLDVAEELMAKAPSL